MSPGDIRRRNENEMDPIKSLKKICLCCVLLMNGCNYEVQENKTEVNTELIVEIRDLTPPIINLKESVIHTDIDKEIDLSKVIKIIDNKDHNLTYKLEGTINYQEPGEYKVKISAEDSNGNIASDIITVIVDKIETDKNEDNNSQEHSQPIITPIYPHSSQQNTPIINQPIEVPKPNSNNHSPVPASVEFLFSDGYTYESAYSACINAGTQALDKGQAAKYTCNPIKVGGKYTGYNLAFE